MSLAHLHPVRGPVCLFPGQGAFDTQSFAELRTHFPAADYLWHEVDAVVRRRLGRSPEVELARLGPTASLDALVAEAPESLQFGIFALSVALFRVLETGGMRPGVLLGHSLGELAALTCAGVFDLETAAGVLCERVRAIRSVTPEPGGMAAIGASEATVAALLASLLAPPGGEVAIAVVNGPEQVVIAGTSAGIDAAERLARAARLAFARLRAPCAFHFPRLMRGPEAQFRAALRSVRAQAPRYRVYSPILGRDYPKDLSAEVLADHLLLPVRFDAAARILLAEGHDIFLECGARDALSRVALGLRPGPRIAISALPPGEDVVLSVQRALSVAGVAVAVAVGSSVPSAAVPAPDRAALFGEVAALFGEHLEYPVSVFSESVALEADLAVDSVKQTELFAALQRRYGLGDGLRSELGQGAITFGEVVDRLAERLSSRHATGATPTASPVHMTGPVHLPGGLPGGVEGSTRPPIAGSELRRMIAELFAEVLEYPESVFTDSVALEADLAIDSVKQVELLTRLTRRFELREAFASQRLGGAPTFGDVVALVQRALGDSGQTATTTITMAQQLTPAPSGTPLTRPADPVVMPASRRAQVLGVGSGLTEAITAGLRARGWTVAQVSGTAEAPVEVVVHVVEGDGGREHGLGAPLGAIWRGVQDAAPGLRHARGGGALVNVVTATADTAPSVTAAALEALTRHLAAEHDAAGLRINTVATGTRGQPPLAAIADAALFFTSDAGRWITGQVLRIDRAAALPGIQAEIHGN